MIDLDSFRDWVHKTLDEKKCKKIAELKQEKAKTMFAEKCGKKAKRMVAETCGKKAKRKYLVTETDHINYKVDKKISIQ